MKDKLLDFILALTPEQVDKIITHLPEIHAQMKGAENETRVH